ALLIWICSIKNIFQPNEINTRSELKKYDPELAKLISEWFVDDDWRFKYPRL
ncbi:uncharacterized protein METZ01_LOCUS166623, partial [marine metagenome]